MSILYDPHADAQRALSEDVGSGDVTAQLISEDCIVSARIVSREPMLVCGQPWVHAVFLAVDASVALTWLVPEGTYLNEATTLCHIHGPARSILTAERSALNFLQTLSGTATQTRRYVQALERTPTRLLDTRKTLPGLRLAQKYAVVCAGGQNHRFGLYDAFLIKENHIKACGTIAHAVTLARADSRHLFVEVEVENLDELREALDARPDRILLDNFTEEQLISAVALNQPKRCDLEVSGGVTLETIARIARTGVDYISVGALTKSVHAIDLSLLIEDGA